MNLRQRKYFAHAAHGSVGVVPNRAAPLGETVSDTTLPGVRPDVLRVGLLAAPAGDDAGRALDDFWAAIADRLPHGVTRLWESADDGDSRFAELHRCDVACFHGRQMPLDGEALARVQWYCQRGRPLVALSAGVGPTFAAWPGFDCDVLGIEASGTLAPNPSLWGVDVRDSAHPLLAHTGFREIGGRLPQGMCLADSNEILLDARTPDGPQPLAWTRSHGSAHRFATTLGQREHLALPAFVTLVGNALRWAVNASRSA